MKTLRAASPLSVGDVTLVPIERMAISTDLGEFRCWVGAIKEPFAVVVCDAGGIRALALDSSEVDLDSLLRDVPNLDAILSGRPAS